MPKEQCQYFEKSLMTYASIFLFFWIKQNTKNVKTVLTSRVAANAH